VKPGNPNRYRPMKTLLFSTLLLLSAATAQAQAVRKVAFRVLCPQPHAGLTELVLPAAGPKGKATEVTVYTAAVSPVVEGEFKGAEAVLLAKDGGAPVARGKLATSKRQLFLLVPVKDEGGKESYEIRAYDDDVQVFKPGAIRAINLSPQTVRLNLAGKPQEPLPPGGGHAIYPQVKEVDEYGIYPAIAEAKGEGDTWTKMYSSSWKASGRRREIVLIQYGERFKQLEVRVLSDDAPWLKAK
jgi:hypothetical protein